MSMTIPTLSPNFSLKSPLLHLKTIPFRSSPTRIQSFNPKPKPTQNLPGKRVHFLCNRKLGFSVKAAENNGQGEEEEEEEIRKVSGVDIDEAETLARGESTLPDRFKHLTKEAPDPPLRWPWFVALAFVVYAWRAVLLELSNWKKAAFGIVGFLGYLLKLALALIFHFIGDPITTLIRCVETAIYTIRAFYSGIVAYTPIPELTVTIMLASAVLAIAETAVPNAVSSQPYLLTLSGLIGYAAVRNYISEPFFWTLLLGMYGFSRLVKKRDDVSAALPVAAVLAAVGEPWVRVLVIGSYLALAISNYSKKLSQGKEGLEVVATGRQLPVPLLCAALAIGIRVAANWVGYRHLTWMIV